MNQCLCYAPCLFVFQHIANQKLLLPENEPRKKFKSNKERKISQPHDFDLDRRDLFAIKKTRAQEILDGI